MARVVVDGGCSWDTTIAGLTIYGQDGKRAAQLWPDPVRITDPEFREDLVERVAEAIGLVTFAPPVKTDEQHLADRINGVNFFAEKEGWAIFNDSEIQRIDSPDNGSGIPLFACDDDAIEHVKALADNGSVLHRMALQICADAQQEVTS